MTTTHSTSPKATAATKLTIVVVWGDTSWRVVKERRTDLGELPIIEYFPVAKSAPWLFAGTRADVTKARAWAASERPDARVYTYPQCNPADACKRAEQAFLARRKPC